MGLTWIVITTVLAAPGCAQLPIPRSNSNQVHLPTPDPKPLAATKQAPETPSLLNESEQLPPLPPDLVAASESSFSRPATPTTLLDEALVKADAELTSQGIPPALDIRPEPTEPDKSEPVAQLPTPEPQSEPEPEVAADPKLVALRALAESTTSSAKQAPVVIDPEKQVKPADPNVLWSEGITRLQKLASEQASASGTGTWSQRSRLLEIIGDDSSQSETKSESTRPYRMALAALGIPQETESLDAPLRGAEIRAAVVALEGESPLEISELQLCRKVNGFANYDPMDAAACKAGQPLIVYCEMSGLQYSQAGDSFHSRLSSRIELVPGSGGHPVWAQSLGSAEDVCRRRRRDYYVNYRIVLAETIPPGVYELRVVQTDEVAGRSTSASIPLTIQR